ncbi:MAG TPA: DinB family protein [Terracidiphilus sp.]|jgi:hypothetical protein|nr:DinB family protein [Terracidiphilus sp.]
MEFNLESSLALLTRTPAVLDALLRDLPDTWATCNEGEKTWTSVDIVGHYLYTEQVNWMPRAGHILKHGGHVPFQPFKRAGHLDEAAPRSLENLLDEFARTRAGSIAELRSWNLSPSDLTRRGLHPVLGSITLAQLLSAWTVHDLTHLHQITRVFAVQYADTVGPFRKFLGVLHCAGHSEPA